MPDPSPNNRELGRLVALSQVGLEMVVPLGVGLLVDHYFSTRPWGIVVGMAVGFIGGLAHLIALGDRKNGQDRSEGNKR